jgi:hypothetical protein
MDYSTLNLDYIKTFQRYSDYGGPSSGCGCAGDAPGFPTYFLKQIGERTTVTLIGTPELGERIVPFSYNGPEQWHKIMRRMWVPLPYDHPRTRMWVFDTYKHHHNCYNGFGKEMVIYPVPRWRLISANAFDRYKDDATKSETVKTVERLRVRKEVARIEREQATLATPENHNAVKVIRKFYPDHQPVLPWIHKDYSKELPELWWETCAERPSEEDCAKTQRWHHQHPFGKTHCQWCGRSYPKDEKVEQELTIKVPAMKIAPAPWEKPS